MEVCGIKLVNLKGSLKPAAEVTQKLKKTGMQIVFPS
jgi:hypothetical protein